MNRQAWARIRMLIYIALAALYNPVMGQVNNSVFTGSLGDGYDSRSMEQAATNSIFTGSFGDGYDQLCFEMPSTNLIFGGSDGDGYHANCYSQPSTNQIYGGGHGDGYDAACFKQPSTNLIFAGGNGDGYASYCFRMRETNMIYGGSSGDGYSASCFKQSANHPIFAGGSGDGYDALCYHVAETNAIFAGGTGDGYDAGCGYTPACGPGNDNTPPTALCTDLTIALDATGQANIVSGDIDAGSSDVCGIASLTLDQSNFDCSNIGMNSVLLTVTDISTNVNTCSAFVTVKDNILPQAICKDVTIEIDTLGTATILAGDIDGGSSDNCGIASMILDQSSFACSDTGVHSISLTVADQSGNTDSCVSLVTVSDLFGNCAPPCNEQVVVIDQGWSIISSYILPDSSDILTVLAEAGSKVIILKDNKGQVVIPSISLNQVGDWDVTQGYKVKATDSLALTLGCTQVDPGSTPINLQSGWNMISYLRTNGMDAATALGGIAGNIFIVKDGAGNIYDPVLPLNTIGDMLPGQGYQIKMTTHSTLLYPANSARNSVSTFVSPPPAKHYIINKNTGNNATILIPDGTIEGIQSGDEIGVFNETGELTGSVVYNGNHMAIAVWGNDALEDEQSNMIEGEFYQFQLWKSNTNEEFAIVADFNSGYPYFETNGVSVMAQAFVTGTESGDTPFNQPGLVVYPNPATDHLIFEVTLAESLKATLTLRIFDLNGREASPAVLTHIQNGHSVLKVDLTDLNAGEYIYQLLTKEVTFSGGFIKVDK